MSRNGIPIDKATLSKTIRTGVEIANLPGQIPVFYEFAACKEYNYRYYHDWQELTPEQQSTIIAHYVLSKLIQSHTQDAELREMSKKNG